MGQDSEASGEDSTVLGQDSNASGVRSTAVGQDSIVSGTNSTVVGQGAVSSGSHADAFGRGTETSRDYSQKFAKNASGRSADGSGTPTEADSTYAFTGLGLFEEKAYITQNSTATGAPVFSPTQNIHDSTLGDFQDRRDRSFETAGATRVVTVLPDGTLQTADFGFDGIDDLVGDEGPETLKRRVRAEIASVGGVTAANDVARTAQEAYVAGLEDYLADSEFKKHDEIEEQRVEVEQLQQQWVAAQGSSNASLFNSETNNLSLRPTTNPNGSLLSRTENLYEGVGASDFQRQRLADTDDETTRLGDRYITLQDQLNTLEPDGNTTRYGSALRAQAGSFLGDVNGTGIDREGDLYEQLRYYEAQEANGFDVGGVLGTDIPSNNIPSTIGNFDSNGDGWVSRGEIEEGIEGLTVRERISIVGYLSGVTDAELDTLQSGAEIDSARNFDEIRTIEEYIAAATAETEYRRPRNVDEFITQEGQEQLSPETLEALRQSPFGSEPKRYGDLYERNAWVQDKIDEYGLELGNLRRGVAMSAAMRTSTIAKGDRSALDLNFSEYRGEYGMAGSFGIRVNNALQVHFAGATTSEFQDRIVRTGLTLNW